MPLQAGKLDRRITLQRATETRDEFNAPVQAWADLATVWASKEDVRDSERVQSQQVGASITTRFQIRWSRAISDFGPQDRVIYEGRVHEVLAVKEIGRREGLEITASARAERA